MLSYIHDNVDKELEEALKCHVHLVVSSLPYSDEKIKQIRNATMNDKSRKETPQKLTQLSSRSHPRHLVGKKDSTKRHYHRHHNQQPGEQQFPKQVVTG